MGDAGEGLIDAESRIQERMDQLELERSQKRGGPVRDPERVRMLESLRLARTELEQQLSVTTHERRRGSLQEAIDELNRAFHDQPPSGFVQPPFLVTKDSIHSEGGDQNTFIPSNDYKKHYLEIWGVAQ